jgi:plastocyanin
MRHLPIPRKSLVALLALLLVTAVSTGSAVAAKRLSGTVGPGFTISLKSGGKKVTSLRPGSYRITVRDRADIHNFHLRGPGVNKRITGVDFEGTKSVTLRLRKGTYRYQCDPHSSDMHGRFKVR